ncbi:MAG: alpha/beta hydrolase family protein, partial [Planctomycetota bacterium]
VTPSAEPGSPPELRISGLYLEAESFSGPWRLQTNYPGYSGSGFRVSNARGVAASELRLRISVREGGEYAAWARGLASPGGKRAFAVEVGGERFPPTHGDAPKTGFRWERCGSLRLEPGPVEIVVRDAGEGYECPDAVFLSADPEASPPDPAARLELVGEASAEAARRANLDRYPALLAKSRRGLASAAEGWRAREAELERALPRILGLEPEPPKTALRARAAGILERDGYRIESLVFESRPDFPVTANLYLPSGPRAPRPPFPAVLCPVGHWGLSKAEPVVQSRAASFARLGLAALVYDPLGQGERAVPGNEHAVAHLAALLGESNMTYMVWDSVRALDWLETRAEIDRERIGCTGCSGGGLNTLYLSAFEAVRARAGGAPRRSRIRASAPVGYISTFSSFLATGITHCPCSHVPGIGAATDMDEVLGLFAPEALLVVGGKRDPMFTEAGMREAFRGIAAFYEFSGTARPPELFFDDCGHDYSKPMRERAYGFFLRELLGRGDGSPLSEPLEGWSPEPPEALFAFPEGRVPPEAATYRSLVSGGLAAERGKD